jgi:hypothetical protein
MLEIHERPGQRIHTVEHSTLAAPPRERMGATVYLDLAPQHGRLSNASCVLRLIGVAALSVSIVACENLFGPDRSLSIGQSSITLDVGDTRSLTVTVEPSDAPVRYTSNDNRIASVFSDGSVEAYASGRTWVHARHEDDAKVKDSVQVIVRVQTVSRIDLSLSTVELLTDQSTSLRATLRDRNGNVVSGRQVSWSSSASSIAAVDSTGRISGLRRGGPVTITARSDTGVATASVIVRDFPQCTPSREFLLGSAWEVSNASLNCDSRSGFRVRAATLTVPAISEPISAMAYSRTGIARIAIATPAGELLATSDATGTGAAATLTRSLSPGTYHVLLGSRSSDMSAVQLSVGSPDFSLGCNAMWPLRLGGTQSFELGPSHHCVLPTNYAVSNYQVWIGSSRAVFEMQYSGFRPTMLLIDPISNRTHGIARTDASGTMTFSPEMTNGLYFLSVSSADPAGTGAYTLRYVR